MDRRAFLFSTAWLAVAPAPDIYQSATQLGGSPVAGPASDDLFDAWKAAFIDKAVARGLPRDQVTGALAGVVPDPHVIALDQRQPEFSKPISGYINSTVSAGRVAEARSRLAAIQSWLDPIADRYRVSPEVLVAIWGMESNFGQIQGDDDVIRSYATLAAEGRRQQFAEDELIGALRILFSGEATRGQLKGSWAGAMGQTQFTPLDYLEYAVDGDGDGKRDIWGSAPDALASTANFMAKKGHWQFGQSAQIEVAVHAAGFDYALVEGPAKTPADWAALGVTPVDPRGLPDGDRGVAATLLMPMGWQGPGFLAFPNHMAIRAYNNSTSYALAVGLLADRIAGGGPIVQAWPADQPISLDDRKAAQQALAALGYYSGEVDGLLGTGTRKAARLWQASQNLPADGYLSYALIQRLKARTGAGLAPANPTITPTAPGAA
jgi:membrane-bound lytic murein transglycosylase B